MTLVTVRPTANAAYGTAWTVSGTADHDLAWSDNSDTTYATAPSNVGDVGRIITFAAPTLPAGSVPSRWRVRAKCLNFTADGSVKTLRVIPWVNLTGQPQVHTRITWTTAATVEVIPLTALTTWPPGAPQITFYVDNSTLNCSILIYEAYADFYHVIQPVTTVSEPTGTLNEDNRPLVQWSNSLDSEGGGQTHYEVKIFDDSAAWDPDTDTGTQESGITAGAETIWQTPEALANDGYTVYVRAAQTVNGEQHWGAWDSNTFTVSVDVPAVPDLSATGDSANARIVLTTEPNTSTAETTDRIDIERSYDSGTTWEPLRTDSDGIRVSYRAAVLAKGGLTGFWMHDAETGVTDLSVSGNDGAAQGGAIIGGSTSTYPLTAHPSATTLDGSNDFIQVAGYNPLLGDAFTVVGWYYRDSTASVDTLFSTSNTGAAAPRLMLSSGSQNVTWQANGTSGTTITWAAAWTGNAQWVFYALAYSDSGNTASLYIGGPLVSTQADPNSLGGSAAHHFQMGLRAGASDPFLGRIGPHAVYDRALGANEIADIQRYYDSPYSDLVTDQYDYEAPNGVTASYRARAAHLYTTFEAYSAWTSTDTASWTGTDYWLKHPTDASLNATITLGSPAEGGITRAGRISTYQPLGSDTAIAISDPRAAATGTIKIRCDSDADRDALDALLVSAVPLLFQHVPGDGEEDRWLALATHTRTRLVDSALFDRTWDVIEWTEVAAPAGSLES